MNVKRLFSMLLASVMLVPPLTPTVSAENEPSLIITLDAGHGINSDGDGTGTNGAVEFGGVNEVYYNWEITCYCKHRLEEYGALVYLTKDSVEHDPSFDERVIPASENGSVAFISIHNNYSSNPKAKGTQIYTVNDNYNKKMYTNSLKLANRIMIRLNKDAGTTKNADPYFVNSETNSKHPDGSIQEYYAVLWRAKRYSEGKKRGSKLLAGMIVECAFLSNKNDVEELMLKSEKLKAIGYAIADGIADHYKLTLLSSETDGETQAFASEDITKALQSATEDTQTARKNGKMRLAVAAVCVTIVLIGAGATAYIMLSKKSKKKK